MKPAEFHRIEELEDALEEYAAFQDGVTTTHLGDEPRGGGDPGQDFSHWRERVMRQNIEIDIRMELLYPVADRLWMLIHPYYRQGLCYESDGWQTVADWLGMPTVRQEFDKRIELAVRKLWRIRT